ncbi:sensor histidine kinase [Agromyces sp. LHK192]|uniref:sensor histidine kinase n=1 Tax=Agromyces sp. LHK192 TaxID=2498704 RepID=UPI000FD93DA3|nr:histidine kinase [Agromyces sp. LHK192]
MTTAPEREPLSRGKLVTDLVLAGLFGLACLPFALLGNAADIVALIVFVGALAVRRLEPAWSLGIAWVAALVQMLTLRDLQLYDAAVLGVLYSTSAHGGRLLRWLGLASAGVGALVATLYLALVKPIFDGASSPADAAAPLSMAVWMLFLFVASIAVLVLAWTAGLLVRAVRDSRDIRRREEEATRKRELAEYRYAVEQERNRIARDMHDVVAHSLAVVIAQADGARFAATTRPEASVTALGTIAEVARGALGDVRSLLAELRHTEAATPQPVLDDLDPLLDQLRAAGLDLRFDEVGDRTPLGTGHQIAVYRIVQEGLTNALRHGDVSRPVELRLTWSERGVLIDLVNRVRADAPRETTGFRHGIPGMRERAQLAGGALQAEYEGEDRFRLVAEVPATKGRTA